MAHPPPIGDTDPGTNPNEKLTVSELCAELKIARSTFYAWRQQRCGPRCVKLPNGGLRIRRRDLDAWLAAQEDRAAEAAPARVPSNRRRRHLSYDVRIWETRVVHGAHGRTYQVRWTVAGTVRYATFAARALAASHEAKIRTAAREGEAFDATTGLPLSLAARGHGPGQDPTVSWYEFACTYVDMKWEQAAPNSRRAIADALATATPALLAPRTAAPSPAQLRQALYGWAFNTQRRHGHPPAHLAPVIAWVRQNTVPLTDLGDPDVLRRVLGQLARKLDGTAAAATVVARKRAVLFNLLGYAVENKYFPSNPLLPVRWKPPSTAAAVDRRRVVNPRQARALLDAVASQGPGGRHLVAFFGCLYHAALRPAEAAILTHGELQLPDRDGAWGWFHLTRSAPTTGGAWNESGTRREQRHLKHRSAAEVRTVPMSPALARLVRNHVAEHGTTADGLLFRGHGGGLIGDTAYTRTWQKARQAVLSPAEAASPLAARPYDLRHACLSTWLNAGVAPAQVAEWAGNSVPVLLRVYTKCLTGSEQAALHQISQAAAEPH